MDIDELKEQAAILAAKLKPRQRRFVEEYEKDGNATRAAQRAGYSEKNAHNTGYLLLRNADILAYRRVRASIQFAILGISRESLAADLVEIKERCMQAQPVMEWDYSSHEFKETGEWQFNARGATKAIEVLADMIGGREPQKLNISGHLAMPAMSIDEREQILREIAEEYITNEER